MLSRSSTEAEYRGVANIVAETCWLRNLLRELHTPLSFATLVYCDNVSAVYLSCNPVQHQRTKHIEFDIHFVRDLVAAGQIVIEHDRANTLAEYSPNNDLIDTIPEMFTDEHTLDFSSPPKYDDANDDLFDLKTDNDECGKILYDDPFDSKEDKIKESKLLIDELDPPRSSDFLPSPECDSVLYKDFSEVDALPSTNNEDKVFNPGILIHDNLFEVTIRATPDKNVKKTTNGSLILEDFNPPVYELPFHKNFPDPKLYSRFHSKKRKKFSTPGFSLLKKFILLFFWNYLIGTLKLSKSLKFLKVRWRFFLALMERTSVFWMLRDCPDFEASRAYGFVLRSLKLQILSFIMGIQYPNLIN
ncbi:reverse transcriptase domain-containing protein [Tanacetum coccineum]